MKNLTPLLYLVTHKDGGNAILKSMHSLFGNVTGPAVNLIFVTVIRKFILLFFLISLVACSKSDRNSCLNVRIDIKEKLSEKISIRDICKSIDLIPLGDSIFLSNGRYSNPGSLVVSDSSIYILDSKTASINIYDRSGHMIKSMDKTGRGPGEYLMACQLAINKFNGFLEILNPMGSIMRYSLDPSNIFESKIDFDDKLKAVHDFEPIGNNNYMLYSFGKGNKFYTYDYAKHKLKKFSFDLPYWLFVFNSVSKPLVWIGDKLCFYRSFDGMLYEVNTTHMSFTPLIMWDFRDKNIKMDNLVPDKDAHYYSDYLRRNSENIAAPFIFLGYGDQKIISNFVFDLTVYTLIYDIESKEVIVFDKTVEGVKILPTQVCGNHIYMLVEPDYIWDYIWPELMDTEDRALLDNLPQDSNTLLIDYTMS